MFHTRDGLRLTPLYDVVAAAIYKQYQSIALETAGIKDLQIGNLSPKHLLRMGEEFGFSEKIVAAVVKELEKYLPYALKAVAKASIGTPELREQLIEKMEERWKESFASIGQLLSKKQNTGVKSSISPNKN